MEIDREINTFIKKVKKHPEFKKIIAVILYGSSLDKNVNPNDKDLCFVYDLKDMSKKQQAELRLKLSGIAPNNFDVQMYSLLPLYVKIQILKGKIVFVKNLEKLYEIAIETIKEFDDFKIKYLDYISNGKVIV